MHPHNSRAPAKQLTITEWKMNYDVALNSLVSKRYSETQINSIGKTLSNLPIGQRMPILNRLQEMGPPGEWMNAELLMKERKRSTVKETALWIRLNKLVQESRDHLEQAGRCKSTVELLLQYLHVPGLHVAAALIRQHTGASKGSIDHSNCTTTQCHGLHISPSAQDTPAHNLGSCRKPCMNNCFDQPELSEIILSGGIPLRFLSKTQSGHVNAREITTVAHSPRFVAISYVWAQRRQMPQCQLSCLHRGLRLLLGESETYVSGYPIWLDVACIPQKGYLDARKRAIGQIPSIYEQAEYVLVVDDLLLETSKLENPVFLGIKILASDWMRRMWTMQEAINATRPGSDRSGLHFQMMDGVVSYIYLIDELSRESCPTARSVNIALRTLLKVRLNMCIVSRFERLFKAIEYRSTSRQADEPVCAAPILFRDYTRTIPWTTKVSDNEKILDKEMCDARMVQLFQALVYFPLSIIFCNAARVSTVKNFSWLPDAFTTRMRSRERNARRRSGLNDLAWCNSEGLYFEAEADMFSLVRGDNSSFTRIHLRRKDDDSKDPGRKRIEQPYWERNNQEALGPEQGWKMIQRTQESDLLALITCDASMYKGIVLRVKSSQGDRIEAQFLCPVYIGFDDEVLVTDHSSWNSRALVSKGERGNQHRDAELLKAIGRKNEAEKKNQRITSDEVPKSLYASYEPTIKSGWHVD